MNLNPQYIWFCWNTSFVARIKRYIKKNKLESDYYATFQIKLRILLKENWQDRFEELKKLLQFGDDLFRQFVLYIGQQRPKRLSFLCCSSEAER